MAIGVNVQAMRLMAEGLCYLDVLGCSFVLDGSGISRSPFALHPFRARAVRGYGWQCGIVRMRLSFQESRRPYSRHGRNRHGRQLMSHGTGCGRRHCGHCRLDALDGARKMYAICQRHILDRLNVEARSSRRAKGPTNTATEVLESWSFMRDGAALGNNFLLACLQTSALSASLARACLLLFLEQSNDTHTCTGLRCLHVSTERAWSTNIL
jgi:hypothetical protein